MCMGEVWKPTNRLRALCLDTLYLVNHDSVLEDLQPYISKVQTSVDYITGKAHTWHVVEAEDMVIIPVKVAGMWALYLNQRST